MRIAWVLYGELTQRTGGTIYDAEVIAGLRRAGDEVTVLSLAPARAGGAGVEGVEGVASLVARVRGLAPDVVVGDELCFRELAILFARLHGAGTRRVLLVHHLTRWESEVPRQRRRVHGVLESLAMRASDLIITTSETTRRRVRAEGARAPIVAVLPGADRLPAGARGAASGRGHVVRLAFLGAIVARKRVLELVRAFADGADGADRADRADRADGANGANGAELVLVGSTTRDPRYVREVLELIARRGLTARVTLLGEVDEIGAARALAASDVLVMPSSLEGYGIAATEAIHAGVPVIAARAQGLEEALARCPAACMFADDEPALARAIRRFATERGLRAAMREGAIEARPSLPTWSACASAFRATLGVLCPQQPVVPLANSDKILHDRSLRRGRLLRRGRTLAF